MKHMSQEKEICMLQQQAEGYFGGDRDRWEDGWPSHAAVSWFLCRIFS